MREQDLQLRASSRLRNISHGVQRVVWTSRPLPKTAAYFTPPANIADPPIYGTVKAQKRCLTPRDSMCKNANSAFYPVWRASAQPVGLGLGKTILAG